MPLPRRPSIDVPLENASKRSRFRRLLLDWYSEHHRKLPWRETTDPYCIWLSEIMLQQTTVAAVIPYFERFLEKFPNVEALANAEEADVLKLWEGLGYYSRARNIYRAANMIVQEYDSQFPQTAEELQKLPGIGRYTAGAISSFACNLPAPIVEANTQRLYARLVGITEPLTQTSSQESLWKFAEQIISKSNPRELNQALMELGSQVCVPESPTCEKCPVAAYCAAYQSDVVDQIPAPKPKKQLTPVTHICVAVKDQTQILVRQYEAGERWAGLWDFVRWEQNPDQVADLPDKMPRATARKLFTDRTQYKESFATIESTLEQQFALKCDLTKLRWMTRHTVTRYRITLYCLEADFIKEAKHKKGLAANNNYQWVPIEDLKTLPLSKTARSFAEILLG